MTKFQQFLAIIVIILATVGVLSITGKLSWNNNKDNQTANNNQKELYGEIVYTHGEIYKKKDGELKQIENGEIINKGDIIKTNGDSKVSILFDDGSVVRLDSNTEIEIKEINKDLILLNKITGTSYNRVAKADNREYTIEHNNIKTTALGTIFIVDVNKDEVKIQVLESQVKLTYKDGTQNLNEGQKLTINTQTGNLNKENILETEEDEFIKWNQKEDGGTEHDTELTDQKEESEKNTEKEVEKTPLQKTVAPTTNYPINLNVNSAKATWSTNNHYEKGYKLVWSKNSNPTYPTRSGDKYAYYSNPKSTEGWLTAFDGTGNYYVRVCEYLGGKCGVYSNETKVYLTAEKKEEPKAQTNDVKSISLKINNKTASWTTDGYSAKGYKLVWSKNPNPTYPTRSGDKYSYHSNPNTTSANIYAFDGTGTYYVRVCEYLGGKCGVYSNELSLVLE